MRKEQWLQRTKTKELRCRVVVSVEDGAATASDKIANLAVHVRSLDILSHGASCGKHIKLAVLAVHSNSERLIASDLHPTVPQDRGVLVRISSHTA